MLFFSCRPAERKGSENLSSHSRCLLIEAGGGLILALIGSYAKPPVDKQLGHSKKVQGGGG